MCNLPRLGSALLAGVVYAAPVAAQTDEAQPIDASNCHDVSGQTEIDGVMQPYMGQACRQPDGSWVFVDVNGYDQSGAAPDYAYYDGPSDDGPSGPSYSGPSYYAPWYWGAPVFFGGSFVFFDNFHHHHHHHHFDHDFDQDRFGHHPNRFVGIRPGFHDHQGRAIMAMPSSIPPAQPSHSVAMPPSVSAPPPHALAMPPSVPAQPPHVVAMPRSVPVQPAHVVAMPRSVPVQPAHMVAMPGVMQPQAGHMPTGYGWGGAGGHASGGGGGRMGGGAGGHFVGGGFGSGRGH